MIEALPCNIEIRIIGEDPDLLVALAKAIQVVVADRYSDEVIPINNAQHCYSKKHIRDSLSKKNGVVITTKLKPALERVTDPVIKSASVKLSQLIGLVECETSNLSDDAICDFLKCTSNYLKMMRGTKKYKSLTYHRALSSVKD